MKKVIALVLALLFAGFGVSILQRWLRDPIGNTGTVETLEVHADGERFRYTINPTGVNLAGNGGNDGSDHISYDRDAATVTYTYTTQFDNEHLSLGAFGRKTGGGYMSNSDECPTVYVIVPEGGNVKAPDEDDLIVSDGVAINIVWSAGYYTSGTASNPWSRVYTRWNGNYRCTDVFTVPKAGTTLTWSETTASGYMSTSALVVASWIKVS